MFIQNMNESGSFSLRKRIQPSNGIDIKIKFIHMYALKGITIYLIYLNFMINDIFTKFFNLK